MNAIVNSSSFSNLSPFAGAATDAFGPDLRAVMRAQCAEFGIGDQTSTLLLLVRIGLANQGAAFVIDDKGRRIPLSINATLLVPQTTARLLLPLLRGPLAEAETVLAETTKSGHAVFESRLLVHSAQRRQLALDLKRAATDVARYRSLSAHLAKVRTREPQEEAYQDLDERLAAHRTRVAGLEARMQAKTAGDSEVVKAYGQELRAARREEPQSYAAEHGRWQALSDPITNELARLEGAVEAEACLRDAFAAHIASEPKKPEVSTLVFVDASPSEIRKSFGMVTARVGATAVFTTESAVRSLGRQSDIVVELSDGPARGADWIPFNFVVASPATAFIRDVKALDDDHDGLLSLMHIVADPRYGGVSLGATARDLEVLEVFDQATRTKLREKTLAMVDDGWEAQAIALTDEAASLLAATSESLRVLLSANQVPSTLHAYLARVPRYICQVAGLLYLARDETGPISVRTLQNAIDVCRWLADEFERAVSPPAKAPPEYADAWQLRQVMQNYISRCVQCEKQCPLSIALSVLCAKSASIGLTKARIRRAVEFMHGAGWIRLRQEGLDYMVDFNPRHFSMAHP
jgi:Protein of unknown function (DUF3987)